MVILCTIDLETREVSLPAGQVIASYDHNVDVIQFNIEPIEDFSLDTSSIKIAAQGPNKARHDYAVDPATVQIEEETGYITFDWPIPQGVTEMPIGSGFKYGDKGQLIFAVCAEIIDGSTVSKAWHSDDGIITVVAHLEPEAGGGEDPEEEATNAQKIGQLQTDVAVINTQVGALGNGSPTPVATVVEMTDESAVYLYTGSETGYTAGNWYYYNGTAWTSGGTYGGATTSTTFNQHGVPADDFAVGEALADKADASDLTAVQTALESKADADDVEVIDGRVSDLESAFSDIYTVEYGNNKCNPDTFTTGSINSDGSINGSATAYETSDFIPIEENSDYTYTIWLADGRKNTSRKYVALYDAEKTFISGTYQNVNNVSAATFNSGQAKYARVSSSDGNNSYLSIGSTEPTAFEPYEAIAYTSLFVENYKDGSIPIEAFSAGITETFLKNEHINLYNANDAVTGVLYSNGGINEGATSYKTSAFIPIKQGYSYTISPKCRLKCLYDDNKVFLSADTTEHLQTHTFISEYTGYLRFSILTTVTDVACLETFDGTATKKIEEGIALSEYQKNEVESIVDSIESRDVLYGKKWAVCGDSFTNSGGTGTLMPAGTKYAGKAYTYPWIIGSRRNMDIVQFFDGGRTLAFPAEPDTFVNSITCPTQTFYYQNIPSDVDYITIYLGINDNHHATGGGDGEDPTGYIPLGTIDDTTTASYYGAWNVVLKWLIQNRPNAHIGIIVTNGIANDDNYRLAQIAVAKKYGIPYIDMNGDSRTPAMLRTSNPDISAEVKQILIEKWSANYPSNQHPNDDAQLYESYFIENFLRNI